MSWIEEVLITPAAALTFVHADCFNKSITLNAFLPLVTRGSAVTKTVKTHLESETVERQRLEETDKSLKEDIYQEL